jgi:hypothetical protein
MGRAQCQAHQAAKASGDVLDRVVAVVNNQAILASDVEDEMRLSVLDPSAGANNRTTPARALDELISRALIEQQMHAEEERAVGPAQAEVDARIKEMRTNLPACSKHNCETDQEWDAFLAAHELTRERVERYVRERFTILRFIEGRFRQGIRVTPQEIEAYYRDTLLPQYAAGAQVPALETVAPRIEEILLQRQVNALFDDWLGNLRRQGEVDVLDPALASPDVEPGPGGVGE